jgi:polysaccharide biosynthesis/export protein
MLWMVGGCRSMTPSDAVSPLQPPDSAAAASVPPPSSESIAAKTGWAMGIPQASPTPSSETVASQQPFDPEAAASNQTPASEAASANMRPLPRELCKTVLPAYVIEPPDILMINAIHIAPRPPYRLRTLDVVSLQVQGTPSDMPIAGSFPIEPGGVLRLGAQYGAVRVAGLTIEEAEVAVREHLRRFLQEPVVTAGLVEMAAQQHIAGQHMVGPDGMVTLGSYGSVRVVGMTVTQAKQAIELYLTQYLDEPEISLDVFAYNSKVYYIVTQGAGMGDAVYRFPVTGNETVLDAISQINGLNFKCSKRIWIARPTDDPGNVQIMPVEWDAITSQACVATNYQVMPGDRVFVAEDKLVAFDTGLGKLTAPLERIMGFSMLGAGTVTRFSGAVLKGGGNPNGTF